MSSGTRAQTARATARGVPNPPPGPPANIQPPNVGPPLVNLPVVPPALMTITDAFNSNGEFDNLLNRIGISAVGRARLIQDEGYENAKDLLNTTLSDLKTAVENCNKLFGSLPANRRIYFPPNKISRLKALIVYLKRCDMINETPDIRLIDADKISEFVRKLPSWTEKSDDTDEIVKKKDITFVPTKFKSFRDNFTTLLCSARGCRGMTLEYVIRETDNGIIPPSEVSEPDVDSNDILTEKATLYGPEYASDNAKVYTLLRTILTGTTGWNVISKFSTRRNGRAAYIALKSHFQGRSYHDFMQSHANNLLTKTFYSGDKSRYKWEDFVAVHMEAHALFEETGEPLPESMKIRTLKAGIRNDAGLENTIEAARTSTAANRTFDDYVNFLTEGITSKRGRFETFKANHPRQVSATASTNNSSNQQRRNKNKSRRRNAHSNKGKPFMVDGLTIDPNKRYSPREYNSLTYNQKNALKKAHREAKRSNGLANDEASTISEVTNRSIQSAVTKAMENASLTESLQNAIVSGVKRASEERPDDGAQDNGDSSITSQFKRRRNRN